MSDGLRIKQIKLLLILLFPLVLNAQPFVTTWKTDNPGTSNDDQITIPTTGTGYDYNVDWGDGMSDANVTGDITHTYATPGTYTVSITGLFPRIYFNAGGFFGADNDHEKILTVENWGSIAWTSMSRAFSGCENLRINAVDAPDLSGVTDMSQMFYDATSFNDNINHWNVSTITNMSQLFRDAQSFNQDIGSWNVDMVTSMSSMFEGAVLFNQNLNSWNVDAVISMQNMFYGATEFNGDVSSWHVENLTSFRFMFLAARAFNQDISGWQINTTSNVSLEGMFAGATSFNQDISFKPGGGNNGGDAWNTSMVTNMRSTFSSAIALTQSIVNWDVANVTTMQSMFSGNTTFNQDISGWSVDNVRDMEDMFSGASSFNQDISNWNVGMVNNMRGMFLDATSFNQDIGRVGGWDVSGVSEMRLMFQNASSFDQNLGGWDFSSLSGNSLFNFLNNSGLSVTNYDNLLLGLQAQIGSLNPSISNFGAQNIYYCAGESARSALVASGWIINDGGLRCIALFDGTDTTAPEIANSQPQAIDFGSINAGVTKTRSFTIENFQSILISDVVTTISTGTGTAFTASPAPVTITSGGTHTFTLDLLSATPGAFAETVTITSSNFGGSFQFTITGEVTATPEPEISVFEGSTGSGTPILNGQPASFDLGSQIRGFSITRDISIKNVGSDVLNINDISFPAGSEFQLVSIPPSSIPVDGTEIIQILITGSNAGLFIEQLTISSDDTDEPAFTFTVLAEIIGPDIWVVDGPNIFSDPEIMNGQVTPLDFGSGTSGSDIVRQLTQTNATMADLFVSDISISGSAFTFTPLAPFTVAGEVDGIYDEIVFEITLSGATGGTFNETVTILNDDNADPIFTFPITGTIIASGCVTPPTAAIGIIADICEGSTIVLAGSIGGAATSSTWTTNGDGVFSDATSLTSTYTAGAADITNGTVTLTLTTNDPDGAGACISATASAAVNIGRTATVNVGSDLAICPTDIVNLSATVGGSANNLLWTTTGAGTFSNNTVAIATYTPDASDISLGSVELTLTADAVGVCPQVSDLLIVTISQPISAANLSQDVNVQEQFVTDVITNSTVNTTDVITVSILQNGTQGTATINADKTISYLANAGTVGSDSFQYRICNQCSLCSDGTVTIDIANTPPVISQPSTPITAVIGQMITIPFSSLISDLNDNIDLSSIQIIQGPTSNAIANFDSGFNLSLDYSTVSFVGTDQITIQVCDLLNDCSQITLQIEVEGEIIVYNGISPNGDGKNDYFLLENIQFLGPNNTVKIFNRWGDKVFTMEDYNPDLMDKRFEGKQNNGTELPSGVYFYKVDFSSNREGISGYLTIKR